MSPVKRPSIAIAARNIAGYGGATTIILEHARRLTDDGWDVHLFGERLDEGRVSPTGGRRHRLFRLPFARTFRRRLFSAAVGLLTRGRFDVIHGHGDLLAQDVLTLHNCVHLAHERIHGGRPPDAGVFRLHRRLLESRPFRRLIANSALMRDDVASRFGVPADDITIVYPGYDPRRFRLASPEERRSAREAIDARPDDFVAGLMTSGDFRKRGVDVFIETLGRAAAAERSVIGLVVGRGPQERVYGPLLKRQGLLGRVRFVGGRDDVAPSLWAMDAFCYPAHIEEFGMAVQEAMACGLPVVASRAVGAMELLSAEMSKELPNRPDPDAFAARLLRLARQPAARRAAAEASLAAVAGNTWEENYRRTKAIYDEVIGERRA